MYAVALINIFRDRKSRDQPALKDKILGVVVDLKLVSMLIIGNEDHAKLLENGRKLRIYHIGLSFPLC